MTVPEDTTKKRPSNGNGYLYCRECHGYYRLKDGESKDDFVSCECGWELEFHESLPFNSSDHYSGLDEFDDSVEIEQLLTLLKSKSAKRKAIIKNLSNHIEIQEGLLNEIKEERWTLWDVLNERNMQNDIKNQKRVLDEIAENEDRLMSIINKQRTRAHHSDKSTITGLFSNLGMREVAFVLFILIVVLLLVLIFI